MDNQYPSQFTPDIMVDVSNFITETIIVSYLQFKKKPMPNSPFWRKEISDNDPWLTELRNKYSLELTAVKDLLVVFSPMVVSACLKRRKLGTLKFLKADVKQQIVSELFKDQVKYVRSLEGINKKILEQTDDKLPFLGTITANVGSKKRIGGL